MARKNEYAEGYQTALTEIADKLMLDGINGVVAWLRDNMADSTRLRDLVVPSNNERIIPSIKNKLTLMETWDKGGHVWINAAAGLAQECRLLIGTEQPEEE